MHLRGESMDMLRGAAVSACFLGIVFSVLENMIPSEKFSRQMNVIFSLILLLVIVTPFAGADISLPDISGCDSVTEELEVNLQDSFNKQVSANLCEELSNLLESNGIYAEKITVNVNNSADGSISIKGSEIFITDSSRSADAEKIAGQALGITQIKVIVNEKKE